MNIPQQLSIEIASDCYPLLAIEQDYLESVYADWKPARPTKVFATYWYFAAERQKMFFGRLRQEAAPWTTDPILARHRFTNAYRASDRVSQYLIKRVAYSGEHSDEDIFFRTLIFKIFNRIETWELLKSETDEIRLSSYSFEKYDRVLTSELENKRNIFSGAYIMPSGTSSFGHPRKHRNYLRLLELMIAEEVPGQMRDARNLRNAFEILRGYPLLGDFLAYQYTIDLNYSPLMDHPESEFVVPGPGARDGIRKCFDSIGGLTEAEIIRLMAERQAFEFARLGLSFSSLWGRPLQLIDCQNIFCEVDKYARIAHPDVKGLSGRTRIKQLYRSKTNLLCYWYPPKWGLNNSINHAIRQHTPEEE